jgi:hypothetical protein
VRFPFFVIAGLDPAIHNPDQNRAPSGGDWMPGSSPGMTIVRIALRKTTPILLLISLGACNEREAPVTTAAVPSAPAAAVAPANLGLVLGPDGRCQGESQTTAAAIEPGIGECELVRLKGKAPTDVLVGESGKGQREVQVLYAEPGARELYFFVDNRLDRIVR